jgi:predicted nucleic acid-binding protein
MKAIVDTCVWSLWLRRQSLARLNDKEQHTVAQLREAIQDRRAVILGPIRQEVLSGIREKTQFAKVQELLDPFPDEKIQCADYVEAARLYNLCQDHGVQCGPVDILMGAVAVRRGFTILTTDQGLLRCIEALRAEGLAL